MKTKINYLLMLAFLCISYNITAQNAYLGIEKGKQNLRPQKIHEVIAQAKTNAKDTELRYDNGNYLESLQIGNMAVAIRWDANALTAYDGENISSIKFYPGDVASASFTLKIWEGADAATELLSQPVTGVTAGQWNEFALTSPVTIDATKELWIGYDIVDGQGALIPGYDDGTVVDGYGNKAYYYNSWNNVPISGNWCIAGIISGGTTTLTPPTNLAASVNLNTVSLTWDAPAKKLTTYKVYRDGVVIAQNLSNTSYDDVVTATGSYEYYVTANNSGGESDPSNTVTATVTELPTIEKYILVEEGTGTWCSWCPGGTYYGDSLVHENDHVIFVAIHGNDVMENTDHVNGAGISSYPGANFDRDINGVGITGWFSSAASALSETPSAGITVTTSYDESTRELTATISGDFVENLSGDYRFGGIITEDGITGPSPTYDQANSYSGGANGSMGGFDLLPGPVPANMIAYNHVSRQLLGGYDGEAGSLPATINSGENHEHSFTFTLPNEWNEEYISVIGYLIAPDGSINNVGKSGYINGKENAKPLAISEPFTQGYVEIEYIYPFYATDPDNRDLEIFAEELPAWLNMSDPNTVGVVHTTATLSGTPTTEGNYNVKLGVTDGDDTTYQEFIIAVAAEPTGSWEVIGETGFTSSAAWVIDLVAANDGSVYSLMNMNDDLQLFTFNETSDTWEQLGSLSAGNSTSASVKIGSDGTTPYVAFSNYDYDVYVKFWDGDSWEQIGGIAAHGVQIGFDLDSEDNPVIGLQDGDNGYKGHAYKYNGSSWETLGMYSNDEYGVWNHVRIDNEDNIYVLFNAFDYSGGKSYVAKYDGSSWSLTGGGSVSSDLVKFDQDIVIDNEGTPYVSFVTYDEDINAYKYDGSSWVNVGTEIVGATTEDLTMAITSNNELIVSYLDVTYGNTISAQRFDGTNWSQIGQRGFSGYSGGYPQIAANGNIPVVCYADGGESEKATAKQYVPLNDATLSSLTISQGELDPAFSSEIYEYEVILPEGTTTVPTVEVTTSDALASYEITDATSIPGTTTIEVTAPDGVTTLTYSVEFDTDASVNSLSSNAFSIYPNPAYEHIWIVDAKGNEFDIYNTMGVKVIEGIVSSNQYQIDVSLLDKGIYFIQMKTINNTITKKVMVK